MGDLWKRHKAKVLWFLGVSGVVCLGAQYAKRKWNKINQHSVEDHYWREQYVFLLICSSQEKFDFIHVSSKNRARKGFNETQQEALIMTCSLSATLNEELGKLLDIEQLTGRLRQMKNEKIIHDEDKSEKMILWDRIKVWSFARTITALYAQILLYLLIKIKFNLIGRQVYLDTYMQKFTGSNNVGVTFFYEFINR